MSRPRLSSDPMALTARQRLMFALTILLGGIIGAFGLQTINPLPAGPTVVVAVLVWVSLFLLVRARAKR